MVFKGGFETALNIVKVPQSLLATLEEVMQTKVDFISLLRKR